MFGYYSSVILYRHESCTMNQTNQSNELYPEVSFSTFTLSLASSALAHLGEVPHPETGKKDVNLQIASHTIDILDMLQNKLKNGLNSEEEKLLDGILYELRMKFICLNNQA